MATPRTASALSNPSERPSSPDGSEPVEPGDRRSGTHQERSGTPSTPPHHSFPVHPVLGSVNRSSTVVGSRDQRPAANQTAVNTASTSLKAPEGCRAPLGSSGRDGGVEQRGIEEDCWLVHHGFASQPVLGSVNRFSMLVGSRNHLPASTRTVPSSGRMSPVH